MDKLLRIIGFTGTRGGMTEPQKRSFTNLLSLSFPNHSLEEFHHGACVGADEDAVKIITSHPAFARIKVIAHPGPEGQFRSEEAIRLSHTVRRPLPFLKRNNVIVAECELLVATPPDHVYGGTWYTIRYAQRTGRRNVVIDRTGDYSSNW